MNFEAPQCNDSLRNIRLGQRLGLAVCASVAIGSLMSPLIPGWLAWLSFGALLGFGLFVPCQAAYRNAAYLFCLVMLAAIPLRVYNLEHHSPGISGHGTVQFRIREQFLSEPLLQPRLQWPLISESGRALFLSEETAPAALLESFGLRALGVSVWSTRFITALFGIATIAVVFFLGCRVYGPAAGFCAALLLALAPWHIHISRYDNTEHVLAPFHAALCLLLTLNVFRRGRVRDYVALGCVLGTSIYIYATNQIFPAVIGIALVADMLIHRREVARRLVGLCAVILICGALSFPQLEKNLREGRFIPIRKNAYDNDLYHVSGLQGFSGRANEAFRQLFVEVGDPWLAKDGGGISVLSSTLFVIGLGILLRGLRRRESASESVLLLLTLLCSFIPGVFGPSAPFRRLIVSATTIEVCAGLGATGMACWLLGSAKRLQAALPIVVIAATIAAGSYYFRKVSSFDSFSNYAVRKVAQYLAEVIRTDPSAIPRAFVLHPPDGEMIERVLRIEAFHDLKKLGETGARYELFSGEQALAAFLAQQPDTWSLAAIPAARPYLDDALQSVPHSYRYLSYPRAEAYPGPEEGDVLIIESAPR